LDLLHLASNYSIALDAHQLGKGQHSLSRITAPVMGGMRAVLQRDGNLRAAARLEAFHTQEE
jgi:hypothetical protein